jgi:hypothetical protein
VGKSVDFIFSSEGGLVVFNPGGGGELEKNSSSLGFLSSFPPMFIRRFFHSNFFGCHTFGGRQKIECKSFHSCSISLPGSGKNLPLITIFYSSESSFEWWGYFRQHLLQMDLNILRKRLFQ